LQARLSSNAIELVPGPTLKASAKKVDGAVGYVEHFADVIHVTETSPFDAHVAHIAPVIAGKTVCHFACVDT
jgi:hypothetical protein